MVKDFSQAVEETAIEQAAEALVGHGFMVQVVDTPQEAKAAALALIPDGSEVFTATSVTLDETGITAEINASGRYDSVRNRLTASLSEDASVGEKGEARRRAAAPEYALGSVHAVTEDGGLLIASASGSQLPAYAYGAAMVIWVVGAQKVVADAEEGVRRIEGYTLPLEDARAQKAYGRHSSINKLLHLRREGNPERAHVILIRDAIGF